MQKAILIGLFAIVAIFSTFSNIPHWASTSLILAALGLALAAAYLFRTGQGSRL